MEQRIITAIQKRKTLQPDLFTKNVLHILNGLSLYDLIQREKLMEGITAIPFNEAMCVHEVVEPIFSKEFNQMRAIGHHSTNEEYNEIVLQQLKELFRGRHETIVLWFGEDMFCQLNMLTILAYLEQNHFVGKVILFQFKENQWKITEEKIKIGSFAEIYRTVLVEKSTVTLDKLPVLQKALELYIELLNEDSRVTRLIQQEKHLSQPQLLSLLLTEFPEIGYGDLQYIEVIKSCKQ